MHRSLLTVFNQTIDVFRRDPRVLGAWIIGSAGSKSEDAFSDVDPMFIVRDDDFDEFDSSLKTIFDRIVDDIILWWPERGNNDMVRNYAVLFRLSDGLFQYDINIMRESAFTPAWLIGTSEDQIIFDEHRIIKSALAMRPAPSYSPNKLLYNIELFWLYGYIIAKYILRDQTFKIKYAQEVFFGCHLEVLHALHPNEFWDWWPITINRLFDGHKKEELLRYITNSDRGSVIRSLPAELNAFSEDAQSACTKWGLKYPDRLEREVRDHIFRLGCLT